MVTIGTKINGEARTVDLDGGESAAEVIRDRFGLTGTKLVCGGGVCGACTVRLGETPVASCLLPATAMRDAEVTTVEGIGSPGALHPVQRAFLAHDGLQCGYCTPGFIVDAAAFVERWRAEHGTAEPDRATIAEALAGHLCRCGAYAGIYRAVAAACRGEHDEGPDVIVRVDGPEKVTGEAVYTADVQLPDMLHAVIVRSTTAAAEIGDIAFGAAPYAVELLPEDRRVRWAGQPIAAVAAETLAHARQFAADVTMAVKRLPFVLDPELAKSDGAPLVYAGRAERKTAPMSGEGGSPLPVSWHGNVRGPNSIRYRATAARHRVKDARAAGDAGLVELEFETHPQLHTSFEPHATVADWSDPELLRLWVSTQGVEMIAREVAKRYELRPEQVEVNAEYVGGGFGAKLTVGPDTVAAIELSRQSRRPVRLVLSRAEELTATGNRPGSRTRTALLVDDKRDVQAMIVDTESHAGVAIGTSVAALCMLVYQRTPRLARDTDIVTNAPPGAPFRGPGGPVAAWALEQTVDALAHKLGRNPLELRQQWDGNQRRQGLYTWAAGLAVWRDRPVTGSQTGRFRRGVGIAAANWMYFVDPGVEVAVSIEDGGLVATCACQDMGTGSRTVVARAVAEVFGIAPEQVTVRLGRSTATTPHGPASGGSRTTVSLWPAARDAAKKLLAEIGGPVTAAHNGASATAKRGGDRGLRAVPVTMSEIQVGRGFTGAVHVTEVEVDTRTGKTRVLTVHGGIATGRPHVPELARSQCEGSIIQGVGLALYENQILDPHTGLTLTANLEDYRVPQLGDTPEITIHFHEDGWDRVPGGGVGLGEVATISPAASVGNAIFNATGWRPTTLPVRPDRVLEGLR
ncbi:molybdopterin-dependent oxidoreductase [Actinokineospora sp. HUAS TT18]|uniref:molybdopterin-dependent oxidoreductase n=1 Tax=Actinokineospora sp. HUAS TT18 TaxID=3447451 RepID=UPI003F527FA5